MTVAGPAASGSKLHGDASVLILLRPTERVWSGEGSPSQVSVASKAYSVLLRFAEQGCGWPGRCVAEPSQATL